MKCKWLVQNFNLHQVISNGSKAEIIPLELSVTATCVDQLCRVLFCCIDHSIVFYNLFSLLKGFTNLQQNEPNSKETILYFWIPFKTLGFLPFDKPNQSHPNSNYQTQKVNKNNKNIRNGDCILGKKKKFTTKKPKNYVLIEKLKLFFFLQLQ